MYFSRVSETGRVQVTPDLGMWFWKMADGRHILRNLHTSLSVKMSVRHNSGVGLEEEIGFLKAALHNSMKTGVSKL